MYICTYMYMCENKHTCMHLNMCKYKLNTHAHMPLHLQYPCNPISKILLALVNSCSPKAVDSYSEPQFDCVDDHQVESLLAEGQMTDTLLSVQ